MKVLPQSSSLQNVFQTHLQLSLIHISIFPCNTQRIPAEKWLHQAKNPSLLVIFPVSR